MRYAAYSRHNRFDTSTDEKWLALAVGPGLLGGCLLRLVLGEAVWVVASWTLVWLLAAGAGTAWSWMRHQNAHLVFLVIYLALAVPIGVLALVAWWLAR